MLLWPASKIGKGNENKKKLKMAMIVFMMLLVVDISLKNYLEFGIRIYLSCLWKIITKTS